MDYNLAYSCVGYGNVRVLRERKTVSRPPLPSALILEKPDPVQFCIDALQREHPDWIVEIDDATRRVIDARLREEARKTRATAN